MDVSRWVDDRLSSLDPPGNWRPDSSAAFGKLRRRDGAVAPSRGHRLWLWATLSATAAAAFAVLLLLISAPPACANPLGCSQPVQPAPRAPSAVAPPGPGPSSAVARPHRSVPARKPNFKETGSPTAPVACQLYSDYECPHCASFHLEILPQLVARYVDTGKVRLLHRDFPLSSHRYARMAARYANAAGEAGYYREAATRLFRTQAVWSGDGDIDGQLAQVVPPAAMEKVRTLIQSEPGGDDSLPADEAMARENHIDRTPTLVCNREVIAGNLSFSEIQVRLDQLLAQR